MITELQIHVFLNITCRQKCRHRQCFVVVVVVTQEFHLSHLLDNIARERDAVPIDIIIMSREHGLHISYL